MVRNHDSLDLERNLRMRASDRRALRIGAAFFAISAILVSILPGEKWWGEESFLTSFGRILPIAEKLSQASIFPGAVYFYIGVMLILAAILATIYVVLLIHELIDEGIAMDAKRGALGVLARRFGVLCFTGLFLWAIYVFPFDPPSGKIDGRGQLMMSLALMTRPGLIFIGGSVAFGIFCGWVELLKSIATILWVPYLLVAGKYPKGGNR